MKNVSCAILMLAAAGCSTSSHHVTGTLRPAISPLAVRVYYAMPAHARIIGVIDANSFSGVTLQNATDAAMEKLKMEAAKLGANAILVSAPDDKVAAGASLQAKAIYVSP